MLNVKITSTGYYAPPKVETADDLARVVPGATAEWIIGAAGVNRRHIAEESMVSMAAKAARMAIKEGPHPDLIINASTTPHQLIPDTSVFIQEELGFTNIPSFTVHATCLSFLVALNNAASLVHAGAYKRILIISSETTSRCRNTAEKESGVLLGDGAAAAILEPTPKAESSALLSYEMTTVPAGAQFTEVRGFGMNRHAKDPLATDEDLLFHMDGPAIFKMGVEVATPLVFKVIEQSGVPLQKVDRVVAHQASKPALKALKRALGLGEDKVIDILSEYGNCAAASLPMALAVADEQGLLVRGQNVFFFGMGAGLSVASAMLRY